MSRGLDYDKLVDVSSWSNLYRKKAPLTVEEFVSPTALTTSLEAAEYRIDSSQDQMQYSMGDFVKRIPIRAIGLFDDRYRHQARHEMAV